MPPTSANKTSLCVLPARASSTSSSMSLSLSVSLSGGGGDDLVRATCEPVAPHNRTVVRAGSPERWKRERS